MIKRGLNVGPWFSDMGFVIFNKHPRYLRNLSPFVSMPPINEPISSYLVKKSRIDILGRTRKLT